MNKDQVVEAERFLTQVKYDFAETIAVESKRNCLVLKCVGGP